MEIRTPDSPGRAGDNLFKGMLNTNMLAIQIDFWGSLPN